MDNIRNSRIPAVSVLAFLCAFSYLLAGVFFFFDPSHEAIPGTDHYWTILAEGHWGRLAFLMAFSFTGLFALGIVRALQAYLGSDQNGLLHWIGTLAIFGYFLNSINYLRLLSGESLRASSYLAGDESVKQTITSFSLVLDTNGWLAFGAVGLYLLSFNLVSIFRLSWPVWLSILGIVVGLTYWLAWYGLLTDNFDLVSLSAGLGAVILGPIWLVFIGFFLWFKPKESNLILPFI